MRRADALRWVAGLAAALAATFVWTGAYAANLIQVTAIAALMATIMRFVMLIGELNFAMSAFIGLGAYGAGVASTMLGWPLPAAMMLGPLVVVAVSVLFGLVTLRVKGPYFMLIGFAFSEAVRIMLTKMEWVGGVSGMSGIFPPRAMEPWMAAFVVASTIAIMAALHAVERSDFGKALVAIRDNEDIARTVGIDVLVFKVICFAIASFCAGLAGSLFAFVNTVISPGDFSFLLACFALAYVKVGGGASIFGAIGGAVFLSLVGSYALGYGAGEHLIYGGAIVLAMLLMPEGFAGLVTRVLRRRGRVRAASRPAVLTDGVIR